MKHRNDNPEEIGKYISALANSACIENREFGYMVWGIEDETHILKGTSFNPDHKNKDQQPLRIYLSRALKPEIAFEFYDFEIEGKSIVILEVEAAYRRPISFQGTEYIRIGESRTELSKHPELAAKIYRTIGKDWSAEIVFGANIDSLDPNAINIAREKYYKKHCNDSFADEINSWSDEEFLNKAK